MSEQKSQKEGKQSTAQKLDSSRHGFDPIPATSPVRGAFGDRKKTTQSDEEAAFAHHPKQPAPVDETENEDAKVD